MSCGGGAAVPAPSWVFRFRPKLRSIAGCCADDGPNNAPAPPPEAAAPAVPAPKANVPLGSDGRPDSVGTSAPTDCRMASGGSGGRLCAALSLFTSCMRPSTVTSNWRSFSFFFSRYRFCASLFDCACLLPFLPPFVPRRPGAVV